MFRGNGSGLRVRAPDVHVILLIPPVFNLERFAVSFPSSSLLLSTIDLITTLLLLQLKMTTSFAQYVDEMMGERTILNQPLQLVGFYLMTYLASHTDRTFLEPHLRLY